MTERYNTVPECQQPTPVLPLRDVVVYPHMVIPLFVGRERSILALDKAMDGDKRIVLVTQKQPDVDEPGRGPVRCGHPGHRSAVAEAARRHRQGAGGRRRAVRISEFTEDSGFFEAELGTRAGGR